MTPPPSVPEKPSPLPLYLSWLGTLTASILLLRGDFLLPMHLSFVTSRGLFQALLEVQVFFMVLLWPFFLMERTDSKASLLWLFGNLGVLMALGLPVALMAADASGVRAAHVVRGQALVGALGAFGLSLFAFARGTSFGPWYFLGAFVVSAGFPFASFLASEFAGQNWVALGALSPFWGAARLDAGVDLFLTPFYGLLALALWGGAAFFRKVDAPAPAK